MTGTLYSLGMLQTGAGFMTAGLIGVMFGLFLEQAGFGSSRKLTSVFYFKDMTVVKVMLTAMAVAMVGYRYLTRLGWLAPDQMFMPETFWVAQIVGGLIFGIGFVVGGWCPGTAIVGVAGAKLDALVFIGGVVLGSILFNEVFPLIRGLYEAGSAGQAFLYETLNIPQDLLLFVFCAAAVVAFAGSTWIERRSGINVLTRWSGLKANGPAALILLLFAGGVFFLPQYAPGDGRQEAAAHGGYLSEVARAEDHVDPLELADLLMKGEKGVLLVDLREPEAYGGFHLRGALNIPLEELTAQAGTRLPKDTRIVLYSNGTTHAAQAWLQLRHWGWTDVKVLTDGILGFWRECLTPSSLAGSIDDVSAGKQYAAYLARRNFFLKEPSPR